MPERRDKNSNLVFDESAIERLVGNAGEKKARFLGLFIDRSAPLVEQIHTGSQSGDREVIGGAAHQLKSTSASIGAMRLSTLAAHIEACARDGGANDIALAEALVSLSPEYQAACEKIRLSIKQLSQGETRTPDGRD